MIFARTKTVAYKYKKMQLTASVHCTTIWNMGDDFTSKQKYLKFFWSSENEIVAQTPRFKT